MKPTAKIQTNFGNLKVEFYPDIAPGHVDNFVTLAKKGFYDGLAFHRILKGFMMQGGCPHGTGTGGPGYQIDAEFSDRQHKFGTLSMARSADPNSAGSQFFICFGNASSLDGKYTVFGQVVSGEDILRKVESDAATEEDGLPPRKKVVMETVTITES